MTVALVASLPIEEPAFIDRLLPVLPAAQRLAYGMLQHPQEAEDAVQDAAFKAWRARSSLREGAELRPWFLAIVANECRQRHRSRWWSVLKFGQLPAEKQAVVLDDDTADVRAALGRLSTRMRLVLILRYYVDLPFAEIGSVLSCSSQAARSRTFRALKALRLEIPEELGE